MADANEFFFNPFNPKIHNTNNSMSMRIKFVYNDSIHYHTTSNYTMFNYEQFLNVVSEMIELKRSSKSESSLSSNISETIQAIYLTDSHQKIAIACDEDLLHAFKSSKDREFICIYIMTIGKNENLKSTIAVSTATGASSPSSSNIEEREEMIRQIASQEKSWEISKFLTAFMLKNQNSTAVHQTGLETIPNSETNTDNDDKLSSKSHSQIFSSRNSPNLERENASNSDLSVKSGYQARLQHREKNVSQLTLNEDPPSMDEPSYPDNFHFHGVKNQYDNENANSNVGDDEIYSFARKLITGHAMKQIPISESHVDINKDVALILSDRDVVRDLQKLVSSEEICDLLVDAYTAEVQSKDAWVAASNHLQKINSLLSGAFEKHPKVASLIPKVLSVLLTGIKESNSQSSLDEFGRGKASPFAKPENADSHSVIEHQNIFCEGCKILGNTDKIDQCIRGIRYKSSVIQNFDICEACEESGIFQESYGPFLKIIKPSQAPSVIFCSSQTSKIKILEDFAVFSSNFQQQQLQQGEESLPNQPSSISTEVNRSQKDNVNLSQAAKEIQAALSTNMDLDLNSKSKTESETLSSSCLQGHELKQLTFAIPLSCSKCLFQPSSTIFVCSECEYGLCSSCHVKVQDSTNILKRKKGEGFSSITDNSYQDIRDSLLNMDKRNDHLKSLFRSISASFNRIGNDDENMIKDGNQDKILNQQSPLSKSSPL